MSQSYTLQRTLKNGAVLKSMFVSFWLKKLLNKAVFFFSKHKLPIFCGTVYICLEHSFTFLKKSWYTQFHSSSIWKLMSDKLSYTALLQFTKKGWALTLVINCKNHSRESPPTDATKHTTLPCILMVHEWWKTNFSYGLFKNCDNEFKNYIV